jgi:DNA-binding NarL/FixJ family response regulator
MLNNGVSGYLLKSCTDDELKLAIKSVNGGKKYYSQEVTEAVMTDLMDGKSGKSKVAMDMPLSDREKEVLHLVIKEYTNQEIADKLFISTRTVDAHKRNILDKTGSKNVAGLVFYALERKLFDDF